MTDQTRPMDAERLAEMRQRAEAATPGPWAQGMVGDSVINEVDCSATFGFIEVNAELSDDGNFGVSDADFIAHARQDIPDLLAEVERLSAERDAERSLREEYQIKLAFRSGDISRLRAVIEEAQARLGDFPARLDHEGLDGMGNEANDVVALLDRGMKGVGRVSDEREFLECEIADAMESDEDCRLEVPLIIRARSQRDEALALLAQRDGELEALRGKVVKVAAMHEPRPKSSRERGALPQGCSCGAHYWPCPTVAALSDNPESPALTDQEA